MTSEAIAVYASRRREASDRIINSADQFMVCSQCLSIAYRRASVCPVCKSYRFCTSPEVVRVVAEVMKGFAFPVTAGVVPRYVGVASASEEPEHEEGGYGNLQRGTRSKP